LLDAFYALMRLMLMPDAADVFHCCRLRAFHYAFSLPPRFIFFSCGAVSLRALLPRHAAAIILRFSMLPRFTLPDCR